MDSNECGVIKMVYIKHIKNGTVVAFTMQGNDLVYIPNAPGNRDYNRMMREVAAGTSTIEEMEV